MYADLNPVFFSSQSHEAWESVVRNEKSKVQSGPTRSARQWGSTAHLQNEWPFCFCFFGLVVFARDGEEEKEKQKNNYKNHQMHKQKNTKNKMKKNHQKQNKNNMKMKINNYKKKIKIMMKRNMVGKLGRKEKYEEY